MDKQHVAFRHGDIVFERVPAAHGSRSAQYGADPKPKHRLTIATGETTGHAHVLDGEVLTFASVDDLLLPAGVAESEIEVTKASTLTHPEHGPLTLPPGRYVVRRQREFWGEARNVVD